MRSVYQNCSTFENSSSPHRKDVPAAQPELFLHEYGSLLRKNAAVQVSNL